MVDVIQLMQMTFKIPDQPFEGVVRYGFTLVADGVQLRGYTTMHIKPFHSNSQAQSERPAPASTLKGTRRPDDKALSSRQRWSLTFDPLPSATQVAQIWAQRAATAQSAGIYTYCS